MLWFSVGLGVVLAVVAATGTLPIRVPRPIEVPIAGTVGVLGIYASVASIAEGTSWHVAGFVLGLALLLSAWTFLASHSRHLRIGAWFTMLLAIIPTSAITSAPRSARVCSLRP